MAKEKGKTEKKIERIYTIPLRKEWMKVPRHKRAKKTMKAIKQFLARHMKVPDRDINKIKIDRIINESVWSRGIKKPPYKITIKAVKDAEGMVKVEFASLPAKHKSEEAKFKKKAAKLSAKAEEKAKKEAEEKKKAEEAERKKKEEEAKKGKTEEEITEEKKKKEKEKILHKEIAKPVEKIMKTGGKKEKPVIFRKAMEK